MPAACRSRAKARPAADERDEQPRSVDDVFRRHFEARFEPLSVESQPSSRPRDGPDDASLDSESEWEGLSSSSSCGEDDQGDGQQPPAVEVVDYSASQTPSSSSTAMSKRDFKAFMSSRPPDHAAAAAVPSTPSSTSPALPEDAPSLLAQDLELRRLLAESHLLSAHPSASVSAGASPAPRSFTAGRTRHKATDLRIQALGSNVSILTQEKMPMNMRKGIVGAAAAREAKRRREARENGVILEREQAGKKRRRDRARHGAVDSPGIGRLRGAELRVSERDVKSIEGRRDAFGRKGAKKR